MAILHIDDQNRTSLQTYYQLTKQYLHHSNNMLRSMQSTSLAMEANMALSLSSILKTCKELEHKMLRIHTFMLESTTAYEQTEKSIQQHMSSLTTMNSRHISSQDAMVHNTKTSSSSPFQTQVLRRDGTMDNIFNLRKALSIFQKKGGMQGAYTLDVFALTYKQAFNKLSIYGDVGLGHANVDGKARIALDKKNLLNSSLELDVGAKLALAHGVISTNYKRDWISGNVQASGDVGVVEAKGTASISKKGVHIEGEVGVAAAKGKISGSINIFGIKLTATARGEAGAVGIGGTFKSESNSFEIGAKASCILGGGFNFKIDW